MAVPSCLCYRKSDHGTEKAIRKIFPKSHGGELAGGFVTVVLICLFSGGVPFLVLYYLYRFLPVAGFVLEVFWCYQLLATRSLKDESMKVYDSLKNGTLDEARYAVSMIVGRDTKELTETGVTKAAVETVAENASDGVIAPMFYMAIGGVPLMFLYKGINTMDSMLGYKMINTCILAVLQPNWMMWQIISLPGSPAG